MASTKILNIGCTTQALYNQGPGALSNKLQATSFKLDRTMDMGYYRTYAGMFCSSMRAIRIWYQHHHKAGITGVARDTQFPDFYFSSEPQATSYERQASSSKQQAASPSQRAASFKPQATSSLIFFPS